MSSTFIRVNFVFILFRYISNNVVNLELNSVNLKFLLGSCQNIRNNSTAYMQVIMITTLLTSCCRMFCLGVK